MFTVGRWAVKISVDEVTLAVAVCAFSCRGMAVLLAATLLSSLSALTPLNSVARGPLSSLAPGDVLQGKVVQHHRDKLYLEVPVVHGPRLRRVNAQLNLPTRHPFLADVAGTMGRELTVHVLRAEPASGRLRVSLPRDGQAVVEGAGVERAGVEGFSRRERRERCADAERCPHRVEDLECGTALHATILSVHSFGAFADCGVTRAGRGGVRRPVDALLPADQLIGGSALADFVPGQQLDVRVLKPAPGSGRLLVTARPLTKVLTYILGSPRSVLTYSLTYLSLYLHTYILTYILAHQGAHRGSARRPIGQASAEQAQAEPRIAQGRGDARGPGGRTRARRGDRQCGCPPYRLDSPLAIRPQGASPRLDVCQRPVRGKSALTLTRTLTSTLTPTLTPTLTTRRR